MDINEIHNVYEILQPKEKIILIIIIMITTFHKHEIENSF